MGKKRKKKRARQPQRRKPAKKIMFGHKLTKKLRLRQLKQKRRRGITFIGPRRLDLRLVNSCYHHNKTKKELGQGVIIRIRPSKSKNLEYISVPQNSENVGPEDPRAKINILDSGRNKKGTSLTPSFPKTDFTFVMAKGFRDCNAQLQLHSYRAYKVKGSKDIKDVHLGAVKLPLKKDRNRLEKRVKLHRKLIERLKARRPRRIVRALFGKRFPHGPRRYRIYNGCVWLDIKDKKLKERKKKKKRVKRPKPKPVVEPEPEEEKEEEPIPEPAPEPVKAEPIKKPPTPKHYRQMPRPKPPPSPSPSPPPSHVPVKPKSPPPPQPVPPPPKPAPSPQPAPPPPRVHEPLPDSPVLPVLTKPLVERCHCERPRDSPACRRCGRSERRTRTPPLDIGNTCVHCDNAPHLLHRTPHAAPHHDAPNCAHANCPHKRHDEIFSQHMREYSPSDFRSPTPPAGSCSGDTCGLKPLVSMYKKEAERHKVAVREMGREILSLRQKVGALEVTNDWLDKELRNFKETPVYILRREEISKMTQAEVLEKHFDLMARHARLVDLYRDSQSNTLRVQNATIRSNDLNKQLLKLQGAHRDQQQLLLQLQEEVHEGHKHKQVCKQQEKVIRKLENFIKKAAEKTEQAERSHLEADAYSLMSQENARLRAKLNAIQDYQHRQRHEPLPPPAEPQRAPAAEPSRAPSRKRAADAPLVERLEHKLEVEKMRQFLMKREMSQLKEEAASKQASRAEMAPYERQLYESKIALAAKTINELERKSEADHRKFGRELTDIKLQLSDKTAESNAWMKEKRRAEEARRKPLAQLLGVTPHPPIQERGSYQRHPPSSLDEGVHLPDVRGTTSGGLPVRPSHSLDRDPRRRSEDRYGRDDGRGYRDDRKGYDRDDGRGSKGPHYTYR